MRWLVFGLLLFAAFGGRLAHAEAVASGETIRLSIMPFNSTMALIKTHQPLVRHLEKALGQRVLINTSADYFTHINELLAGQYDLAITGPHFGSMAADRGAVLLFRYRAVLQPVFVVRNDSPIKTLDDMRGQRIALSSRLSISSIGGVKWLQDGGLLLDKDYFLTERSTHGAAIASVAVGELDAALTTHTPLKQIPEDVRSKIRVLPMDIHSPHLMTLVNGKLGKVQIERIRKALLSFQESPEGRDFFRETSYLGYESVSAADLRSLRPYIDLTVQMMRQGR